MDTTGMVGSMGLTFFCNKCVEVFFKFRRDEPVSNELEETCKQAISAFKSLKWPEETGVPNGEKIALFNTNEEIESFTRVLLSEEGDADVALNTLISDLEFVFQEQSLEKRKNVAKKLGRFFDALGDLSFYATRDCLRGSGTMAGI